MRTFLGGLGRSVECDGVRALESSYTARLDLPRHSHPYAHCCLVLSGHYVEALAGIREERGPMTLICYPANCPHAESHHAPGLHFLVEWDAEWARRFELEKTLPDRPTVVRNAPAVFSGLRALRALQGDSTPWALDIESALLGVFDAFGEHAARSSSRAPGWMRQVAERLQEAVEEPLTLAELADGVGVNPAHLARTFKRFVGCTIGEMRRRMQVESACRRLVSTADTLVHVAVDTGFADQSHMTRLVREATGFTPKALRAASAAS